MLLFLNAICFTILYMKEKQQNRDMNVAGIGSMSGEAVQAANHGMEPLDKNAGAEGKKISDGSKVALTFDDGPHPVYTEKLLEGLKERGVHATFFVTGANAEAYPELVKREQEEGHLIGNHTYSHLQLSEGNREKFKKELQKTNAILEGITGQKIGFVRPPYGTWDKRFEEELNMIPVLWTIDPLDWCSDDADCITRNVVAKIGENSIILMHDQYESTVTAALRIVDDLRKKGYSFVTVEEILFD